MAQGNLKLKSKAPKRVTKKQTDAKKAAPRIIAPRKATLKENHKFAKTHQAQLLTSTEKLIASRVGHLEILKGLRRSLAKIEKSIKK